MSVCVDVLQYACVCTPQESKGVIPPEGGVNANCTTKVGVGGGWFINQTGK